MECPGQKLDGGVDPVPTDNPRMTVVEIARRIGKGEAAVHGARLRYGIGHVWSPEDDQFVRDHRGMWVSVLAAKLERTVHAVHNRRKVLGMPNTRSNVWILKQIRFVRDRSSMPAREVAERIGTTIHGVHHKRREVGMSERVRYVPWSKTDDENVREWTPKIRAKDIAVMMGRTTVSVHLRQKMRGLTRTHGELKCTYAEVRFIRENPHMSAVAIAERLERSPGAVRAMRFKSGLPRMQEKKPWVEELDIVRKNQHLKRAGLYRLFPGRSQSSVGWAIKKVEKQRQNRRGRGFQAGAGASMSEDAHTGTPPGGRKKIGHLLKAREQVHHRP